jgi:hypothetical protein
MADDPRGREYAMNHGHHKVACGELAFWRVSIMRPIGECGFFTPSPQGRSGQLSRLYLRGREGSRASVNQAPGGNKPYQDCC